MKEGNNKRHDFRFWFFLSISVLILMTGCGKDSQPEQDVSIHYHADDGDFEKDIWVTPDPITEEGEKEKKKEKQIITLATSGSVGSDSIYQRVVNTFNSVNTEYYVEITNYEHGDQLADGRIRINAEIGAGGGPDLLMLDLFPVDQEMLDKGVLVDLTPYLEESGITAENYFPAYARLVYGDRIYAVSPEQSVACYAVKQEVLGTEEVPEFEVFLDRLLAYQKKAAFNNNVQPDYYIMKWFIDGSEDLWGVVDWENRTCDFTLPVFSKILDVVNRYGKDGRNGYEPIMSHYSPNPTSWGIQLEALEESGDVLIGYYFDDGCHPLCNNLNTLAINGNTKNLDGAYAFVSFVMSAKGQNCFGESVQRKYWEKDVEFEVKLINEGKSYVWDGTEMRPAFINEDIIQEVADLYDDARIRPGKAEKIQDIVLDESEAYFSGDKTKEYVIELIQNKVQLYLNE